MYMPRARVGEILPHLVLTLVLVAVPALRVLCYDSCVSSAGPAKVEVASSPACHESGDGRHPFDESDPVPGSDDCSHGGDSSADKDGRRVAVIQQSTSAHLPVRPLRVLRGTPGSTAQVLRLLLTPLRI